VLVGKKNRVNDKLVKEISAVYPLEIVEIDNVLSLSNKGKLGNMSHHSGTLVFVNLMDFGAEDTRVLTLLQQCRSDKKLIAIHSYQSATMVEYVLKKGFDHYLSIFTISEELPRLLESESIIRD
jgi:hypothetical protein